MADVSVVDYGSGNLFSVVRAFEHCGGIARLASTARQISEAPRLVLPGVGAFADGMLGLRERGLEDVIRQYAASGRPLLGICLGMQMLASESEEFGLHRGLQLIPGRVTRLPSADTNGAALKVPSIGWFQLKEPFVRRWDETLLQGTPVGTSVYVVHSFQFAPADRADELASYDYGGHQITAAVQRANVIGCQFHPEKSGPAGLKLLRSFLRL